MAAPHQVPIEQRFWSKVDVRDKGECWSWLASTDSRGYGQTSSRESGHKVSLRAHRVAYELVIGKIPEGLVLDHTCHNLVKDSCLDFSKCPHKLCVNPYHLEPVTNAENITRGNTRRKQKEWSASIQSCPRGHPYSEENTFLGNKGERCCKRCRSEKASERWHKITAEQRQENSRKQREYRSKNRSELNRKNREYRLRTGQTKNPRKSRSS